MDIAVHGVLEEGGRYDVFFPDTEDAAVAPGDLLFMVPFAVSFVLLSGMFGLCRPSACCN